MALSVHLDYATNLWLILGINVELYIVTSVKQRYFDGDEIIFLASMQSLANLEMCTVELVTKFNKRVTGEDEDKINEDMLRRGANRTVSGRVSYLVDMAKAEALDAMGDNRAAVDLIERHLEV